jgi:type IV pilus assembly protein PilP
MKKFTLVVFFMLFSLSNAQTPPAANPGAEKAKNTAAAAQDAGFELSPQIDYVYDPTGKKDPFKPYRAPRIRGENHSISPVDPLSLIEVTQLKLVAVMWNTSKPRAVVRDPQNRDYVLFKNMRVGRNDGVVVDIREGELVIVEKFDDGFGNTVREARVLEMNQSDQQSAAGG